MLLLKPIWNSCSFQYSFQNYCRSILEHGESTELFEHPNEVCTIKEEQKKGPPTACDKYNMTAGTLLFLFPVQTTE